MINVMEKLLTSQEIADYLGVKLSTIYSWTHLGFIPHIKVGRLVRFKESDVRSWLKKRTEKGRVDYLPNIDLP